MSLLQLKKSKKNLKQKNASLFLLPKTSVQNQSATPGQDGENSSCTLQQRFSHPDTCNVQLPESAWPARVDLLTKMGNKCPKCDKFVIKPKAGAIRTIFDIQFLASSVLPRITIGEFSDLKKNAKTKIVFFFKNPLDFVVDLQFSKVAEKKVAEEKAKEKERGLIESEANFPTSSIMLAAYDENVEQGEAKSSVLLESDDPNVISYRSNSKVGVYVEVTPQADKVRFSVRVDLTVRPGKTTRPIETFSFPLMFDLGPAA